MNIIPVGNRIIVKKIDSTTTKSGIVLADSSVNGANVWGEIIALPVTDNPWIKEMEIGGKIFYRQFEADKGLNIDENFEVVEVEPANSSRQGQVLAYKPSLE